MLSKTNYAAVEAGSSALGAIRDTRRRRSRAGRSELQSGVSLLARGRNGRKAACEAAASLPQKPEISAVRHSDRVESNTQQTDGRRLQDMGPSGQPADSCNI